MMSPRSQKNKGNNKNMDLVGGWTTPLKNMLVKMGSSSPRFGVKKSKIFELPPPSDVSTQVSLDPNKNLWQGEFGTSLIKILIFFWLVLNPHLVAHLLVI